MSNGYIGRYITLPYKAAPYGGGTPNGWLFPDRETLMPNVPGEYGQGLDYWLQINTHSGMMFNPKRTQDSLLRERGVFGHGVNTVGIREDKRTFTLSLTLQPSHASDYWKKREQLAYILGTDLAFAGVMGQSGVAPNERQVPNPWTYSFAFPDGTYRHIDFFPQDLGGDIDIDADLTRKDFTLTCVADDPRLYAEQVSVPIDGVIWQDDFIKNRTPI